MAGRSAKHVEELVRRMRAEGYPTAAIRQRTGLTDQTVSQILKRSPTGAPTRSRCPRCGFRTKRPCHVCAALKRLRRRHPAACDSPLVDWFAKVPAIGLDLRPEEQARYEAVTAERDRLASTGQLAPPEPLTVALAYESPEEYLQIAAEAAAEHLEDLAEPTDWELAELEGELLGDFHDSLTPPSQPG